MAIAQTARLSRIVTLERSVSNDTILRDITAEWLGRSKLSLPHKPPAYLGVYNDVASNDYNAD